MYLTHLWNFILAFAFVQAALVNARCTGRGSCPTGLECVQRSVCRKPLYRPPPSITNYHPISEIQGPSTVSPFLSQNVTTIAVITAVDTSRSSPNIWIQDIYEDNNPLTSEALYLFRPQLRSSDPFPRVGDVLQVEGVVTEFANKRRKGDLPATQIAFGQAKILIPNAKVFVKPVVLQLPYRLSSFGDGSGYEQDQNARRTDMVDVNYRCKTETESAICYYEAHEHMLVKIINPFTTTTELKFGEIGVISCIDKQQNCGRTLAVSKNNFLPRIITVADDLVSKGKRNLDIGEQLRSFTGIMSYSFGQYKVLNTQPLVPSKLDDDDIDEQKIKSKPCMKKNTFPGLVRIAAWNVLNRDPKDSPTELQALARIIKTRLQCPDIVALSEIGDNDGDTNSAITSASITLGQIANATTRLCNSAAYKFTEIAPKDDSDGGKPGENIRVAFIYRADKVKLASGVAKGGFDDTVGFDPEIDGLSLNPGRIAPDKFTGSRKPLAAEFQFVNSNRRSFIVVVNHWSSKNGDQALFGRTQPPIQASQVGRQMQAQAVKEFIDSVPKSKGLFVVGDLNDFYFSEPVMSLGLENLWDKVTKNERFSYVFQSRFQALDHILVRGNVLCDEFCPVHSSTFTSFGDVNQVSDHDPLVALCRV